MLANLDSVYLKIVLWFRELFFFLKHLSAFLKKKVAISSMPSVKKAKSNPSSSTARVLVRGIFVRLMLFRHCPNQQQIAIFLVKMLTDCSLQPMYAVWELELLQCHQGNLGCPGREGVHRQRAPGPQQTFQSLQVSSLSWITGFGSCLQVMLETLSNGLCCVKCK